MALDGLFLHKLTNELKSAEGSRQVGRRVGRGYGSGLGKNCGTGHKGQNSRSDFHI